MLTAVLSLLVASLTQVLAIETIQAKGSKLFKSGGSQYFVKGVAYQLTDDDPLANPDQCKLDAQLMQTLGANAIRVYHVDPNADHDACMTTFSDAGIYAWIDLDTFDTYLYSPDGAHWNQTQYVRFQKVMDTFANYDNVAGFFVANELLTTGVSSVGAPFIKAAGRDMKAYRDQKGYRKFLIGYSAADIADLRPNLQNYMACGDPSDALDFYSLNAYEWCGDSTFETSGYEMLQQNASDLNIPIFMSETGCITPAPRTFDDQTALLGPEMADWSGAIVYEWIEEQNDYGLISYGPPADATATATNVVGGYTRAGTPTPISPDFDNLSNHWKTLNPTGISMDAYTPSNSAPACPSFTADFWVVSGNPPLPTIGASLPPQASVYSSPGGPTKAKATATAGSGGSGSGGSSSGGSSSGGSGSGGSGSGGSGSGGSGSGDSSGSSGSASSAAPSTGAAARQTPFFAQAWRQYRGEL